MSYFAERRRYQRCDSIICKALMSRDRVHWENVDLHDISAGGLSFVSDAAISHDKRLWFNLYVYNMLSEFNIMLESKVVRMDENSAMKIYSVKFENINKYQVVQLDELIKSKVTVRNSHEAIVQQEEYSLFLMPGLRPRNRRIHIRSYK
jgi:PilZ domain.